MASLKWYGNPHPYYRGEIWSKGQIIRVLEDEGCNIQYHPGFKYIFIELVVPDGSSRDEMVKERKRIDGVVRSKLLGWKPRFTGLKWDNNICPDDRCVPA